MKIYAIYHSADSDGWCCAAIFRAFYESSVTLIPFNYGEDETYIIDLVNKSDTEAVYMADVSFSYQNMKMLSMMPYPFIWIDHHKSAIEQMSNLNILGYRSFSQHAGCSLLWKQLYPEKETPAIIELIRKGDIYEIDNDWQRIEALKAYLTFFKKTLSEKVDTIYSWLNESQFKQEISLGLLALSIEDALIEMSATNAIIKNNICLLNTSLNAARVGSYLLTAGCDLAIIYYMRRENVKVSLRSNGAIDCAALAKEYGGGGHMNAAGINLSSEMFNNFLTKVGLL